MTNVFTRYQSRLERRTGMKIKSVLVGGGTEFDKEFIAYLEGQGITKLKGAPYISLLLNPVLDKLMEHRLERPSIPFLPQ